MPAIHAFLLMTVSHLNMCVPTSTRCSLECALAAATSSNTKKVTAVAFDAIFPDVASVRTKSPVVRRMQLLSSNQTKHCKRAICVDVLHLLLQSFMAKGISLLQLDGSRYREIST